MNIERLYREESGRILATLIRLLGDFDLAEEVVQEAFMAALAQWPVQGMPQNPRAWLVSTARHKALDYFRRHTRFQHKQEELARAAAVDELTRSADASESVIADDQLRLIFTCCHPALAVETQVALTLRTLCGLTTEEIARAFLVSAPTMAQRLVRAKQKIHAAGIPYQIPSTEVLPERLAGVMRTVYLVFNEGYAATAGDALIRRELCAEAIRLGRLLYALLPAYAELGSLLALTLLHDSRRNARMSPEGEIILLEEQDRTLWDHAQIREGVALAEQALRVRGPSEYTLQAAIAALHARAARPEETDWRQIADLYEVLLQLSPSPVIELNRAVAVAMADSLESGLRLIDGLKERGELRSYHLLPAARADLLRRMGRWTEATEEYQQALRLVTNDAERRFLARRLAEIKGNNSNHAPAA